jgi:VWFA-related protein
VKEDGKAQPIRNFEEFGTEKARSLEVASPLAPSIGSNQLASATAAEAVDLLLFDQVATGISGGLQPHPEALKDAKAAASQYLKTMPAGTKIAILELDGSGLHTVQGFTSDPGALLAAVNSITYRSVPESYWTGSGEGQKTLPLLCNAMNFQSEKALDAMNQTVAFVSSIPGRKNLIWFTPGIPWLTNYPPFNSPAASLGKTPLSELLASLIDHTPQLQQVYGRLTAERIAVYPIDARGLVLDPGFAAGGESGPPGGLGDISNFRVAAYLDNGSLDDVAKATGGKAHYSNDLAGALREDTATGADYYALSYVPPLSKFDGKYHRIEVKVDRPGVQLEYRRGYTSLDPAKDAHLVEKSAAVAAP